MSRSRQTAFGLLAPIWLAGVPPGEPVAVVAHEGVILLGTTRGLFREEGSGWGVVSSGGPVHDLAGVGTGTLIAAARGLYEWSYGETAPRARAIAAGARVRSVAAGPDGTAWVATEVGLFARAPGERGFRRAQTLPVGEVRAVRSAGSQVWAAMRGTIWRKRAGGDFEPGLRALGPGWWELRDAVEFEGSTYLCVPRGLWRVSEGGPTAIDPGLGSLTGLARAGNALWLAGERGLVRLVLEDLGAPESTGPLPGLTRPITGVEGAALDVALAPRGVVAATRRGIAVLARPKAALSYRAPASGPVFDLLALHRAVLAYQELFPERLARVERRSRRTGFLPELRTSLSLDRSRAREHEGDQAFSSGAVRNLLDTSRERERSLELEVQLSWDLGKLASPDDAIDISRERRALVELRDQVLDRVNRLYFERLRVIAKLGLERAPESRVELDLRARELAAGLDAWSGGFFSRSFADAPSISPPSIRRQP